MELLHIPGAWPLYTNTFLLFSGDGRAAVVDPAADAAVYEKALAEHGARLTDILLTHGHYDHVASVAALRRSTGAKVRLDPADALGTELYPLTPDLIDEPWPAADGTVEAAGLSFRHEGRRLPVYGRLPVLRRYAVRGLLRAHGPARRQRGRNAEKPRVHRRPAAAGRDKGPARARALFHPWRGAPPKPLPDGGSLVKMFCVKLQGGAQC